MTEDPVKLYVVVMALLLCVLSYVAFDSYRQVSAYEAAIARAPQEAKQMKQLSSEVKALVDQISKSKMKDGAATLVERVKNGLGIKHSNFDNPSVPLGRGVKGTERRHVIEFGSGRQSPPLPRATIVEFCKRVELDSGGILKTIEIKISRVTGDGMPEPGKDEKITGDMYRGTVIFGVRVVEQ